MKILQDRSSLLHQITLNSNGWHVRRLIFGICTLTAVSFFSACASTSHVNVDYDRGINAYRHKDYSEALTGLKKFTDEHPESPLAEFTMVYTADCYRKTGDMDNAKVYYQKAADTYKTGFWADLARKSLSEIDNMK